MDVKAVAGDRLFSQESIRELGFTHENFLQDWHHLFLYSHSDLFRTGAYSVIDREFGQIIHAYTK